MRDPFELAGEAACLLEEMGFVAVARKREGLVMLEFWKMIGREQRTMRYVISGVFESPEELAQHCAEQFAAA